MPNSATHIARKRHDVKPFGTIDYLKVPAFEQGFACLEFYNYLFNLQCAPTQLKWAASLFREQRSDIFAHNACRFYRILQVSEY